jgi:hypothetical protein
MKQVSLPKLKKKAQLVFNAWIRQRDADKPCISCGKYKELQAGHYYSVKMYDGLRFDELNVHGECAGCNCFNDSHLITYGDNLRERIGDENMLRLKLRAVEYKKFGKKWTRDELNEIIKKYQNGIL